MRAVWIWAFAAVAALVASSAARGEDAAAAKDTKDGWTSFKAGSSVTLKLWVKTTPEVPELGGKGELRKTLVSIDDEWYVVASEKRSDPDGEWSEREERSYSRKPEDDDEEKEKKPAPAQALGEEKITLEGTAYVCKKMKATEDGATEITWVHKQHGVLKTERSGPGNKKSTTIVTALAKKVTVAGKKISCREEKTTSNQDGMESTIVQQMSDEVPGGLVRLEVHGKQQQVSVDSVTEVTAFEAK
jgi:hypothetical protein